MDLKYLRINTFYGLIGGFQRWSRRRRMRKFVHLMALEPGARVLDLGGSPGIWEHVTIPLDVTLLNLPGQIQQAGASHHRFRYVEGDACNVHQFADRSFDLVFSNSVIEHVGPPSKQEEFAREVRRLGESYWVQTPSIWFPIEAHSGMPFYWFYPERLRAWLHAGWEKKLPDWTQMVATTRVLSRRRMEDLFPGSRTLVETVLAFPKSYTSYSAGPSLAARTEGIDRGRSPGRAA